MMLSTMFLFTVYFLSKQTMINIQGRTLLAVAIEKRVDFDLFVDCYKANERQINSKSNTGGWTPLHHAADQGRLDMIRYLVEHGANIDAVNKVRQTPIMWLAYRNRTDEREECIKYLIEKGADVDHEDNYGRTLSYYLERYGYKQILDLLNKSERVSENPDDMESDESEQIYR